MTTLDRNVVIAKITKNGRGEQCWVQISRRDSTA